MCLVPQTPPTPQLPAETQAMKQPDGGAVRSDASRRITDRMRAGSNTILTSPSGVATPGPVGTKTLLGQ